MAAEAEAKLFGGGADAGGGDTFLTDLIGKKQNSESKRKVAGSAMKNRAPDMDSEMNAEDIEEELRDVVFDYESSQALVLAADDFLTGKNYYEGDG